MNLFQEVYQNIAEMEAERKEFSERVHLKNQEGKKRLADKINRFEERRKERSKHFDSIRRCK